ncbi:hypothetical protein DNTS_030565 [Danionella cerebrum]|uniref:Uncharacterized protein n=1 Tax=Danionella cerebrum TaxID=2873325 RepID=A0A553MKQ3_9TELE|nr:hypothetical protein DNTS_030565 [Danionella translucida]
MASFSSADTRFGRNTRRGREGESKCDRTYGVLSINISGGHEQGCLNELEANAHIWFPGLSLNAPVHAICARPGHNSLEVHIKPEI